MRLWLKNAMVLAMTLAILLPLLLIRGVIHDRAQYRAEAVADIARSVGGAQRVTGPVLVLPYSEWVDGAYLDKATGQQRSLSKRVEREQVVFPQTLAVDGRLAPEVRRRGLHAVRTYVWSARIDGLFDHALPAPDARGRSYGHPRLVWLLGDVRGLRGTPTLTLGGQALRLQQGSGMPGRPGLHVVLPVPEPGQRLRLAPRLRLELGGTETLAVLPLGGSNDIKLSSPWPHPRFDGLPARHRIGADGFSARWRVDALATDAQQNWLQPAAAVASGDVRLEAAAGGGVQRDLAQVSLIDPVDAYTQADRATKYGILFVLLTFLGFFLFELLRRVPVHPIQYALVGLAIAIFFLLLVSLGEHLKFGIAYLLAAAACIGLIVFYLSAVLRSLRAAAGFGALLVTLYGVLYLSLIHISSPRD